MNSEEGGEEMVVSSSDGGEGDEGVTEELHQGGGSSSVSSSSLEAPEETETDRNAPHIFTIPSIPRLSSSPSRSSGEPSSTSLSHSTKSSSSPPRPEKQKMRDIPRENEEKYKQILAGLKYQPPENSAPVADTRYNLEVLKNGTIVDSVKFSTFDRKGYFIIGRVPGCDIVAENPTISRIHAILQFVKGASPTEKQDEDDLDNPRNTGLYLYDLNSTHGTFLNKNQLFPRKWYRVHVGHVLKFGSSQRMYIVNGPDEDEEEESEKSVTELQNERLQKELERKKLEEEGQLKREAALASSKLPKENIEEEGIDWGMAEDADEASDMRINPFAMDYEASELSLDNPKKTLRSWFEREGHDLEYEIREKAAGQYVCRIGLPLEGAAGDGLVYAESEVKTKKKEAAAEAAMKACQILDSHGVLRTSNQESRKRKEKKWEDEDYYSSDEDTFLDRTGSIEKKREKRMRLAGKASGGEDVMTYESLCTRHGELEKEITELQDQISKGEKMKARADDGDVDIDDYMNLLKSGVFDVKKLKGKLKIAQEEIVRTKKLMEIAKPAELPSYLRGGPAVAQEKKEASSTISSETEGTPAPAVVEEDKDTQPKPTPSALPQAKKPMVGPIKPPQAPAAPPQQPKRYGLITPANFAVLKTPVERPVDPSRKAPVEDDDAGLEEEEESSEEEGNGEEGNGLEEEDTPTPEFEKPAKKKRHRIRNQQRNKNKSAGTMQSYQDDPAYSEWVPPSNQSGDGRTSLNEKLGY